MVSAAAMKVASFSCAKLPPMPHTLLVRHSTIMWMALASAFRLSGKSAAATAFRSPVGSLPDTTGTPSAGVLSRSTVCVVSVKTMLIP